MTRSIRAIGLVALRNRRWDWLPQARTKNDLSVGRCELRASGGAGKIERQARVSINGRLFAAIQNCGGCGASVDQSPAPTLILLAWSVLLD